MTPAERIGRALALAEMGNRFAMALLRQEFPDAPDVELRLRVALRTLPRALGIAFAQHMGYPHLAHDLR